MKLQTRHSSAISPEAARSGFTTGSNHMKNFLECLRSRQDPAAPVEVGHRSNSLCIITHIAMKLGRKLRWDPDQEKFIGDEEANRLLDYPRRKPWQI